MASKYKYVSYNSALGVFVARVDGDCLGYSLSEEVTAKLVAKSKGMSLGALLKTKKELNYKKPPYKHVYFHKVHGLYYGKVQGDNTSYYDTARGAADAIAIR